MALERVATSSRSAVAPDAELTNALWTAAWLTTELGRAAIVEAHRRFLRAGAELLISASYQVGMESFVAAGRSRSAAEQALRDSVRLARQAIEQEGRVGSAWVAASLGPRAAVEADGSEYTGSTALSLTELAQFQTERALILAREEPDALVFETIPSIAESLGCAAAINAVSASGTGPPCIISWTCRDGDRLRSDEPMRSAISQVLQRLGDASELLVAWGVNCTDPEHIGPAVSELHATDRRPVVVYPHLGQRWDADSREWAGRQGPALNTYLAEWSPLNVAGIGGCCGTGPEELEQLTRSLG